MKTKAAASLADKKLSDDCSKKDNNKERVTGSIYSVFIFARNASHEECYVCAGDTVLR